MLLRTLVAFLVLPGVVAFAVPMVWLWATRHTQVRQPLGLIPFTLGIVGLLWCVRDFYVSGRGTLAPWAPPENLVRVGLYRVSRNPMYVSVFLILLGWAITFWHVGLLIYALLVAAAFHRRVVYGEEPWLARTHGPAWQEYIRRVPRWFW